MNKKIKTSGFTKEEEKQFEKMELENAYAKNLSILEEDLKKSDEKVFSTIRDDIIEGRITPKRMLNEYAIRGETEKKAYPILSRYMQKIRERFMKMGVEAGREDALPKYLDRFEKNIKE